MIESIAIEKKEIIILESLSLFLSLTFGHDNRCHEDDEDDEETHGVTGPKAVWSFH